MKVFNFSQDYNADASDADYDVPLNELPLFLFICSAGLL